MGGVGTRPKPRWPHIPPGDKLLNPEEVSRTVISKAEEGRVAQQLQLFHGGEKMAELESGGVLTSPPKPNQNFLLGVAIRGPSAGAVGVEAGVAPADLAGSHQRNRGQGPSPRARWEPGSYHPRPHPKSQAPHGPCHPAVERTVCLEMTYQALLHCEDCELIQFTASGAAGGGCDGGDLRPTGGASLYLV